MGTIFHPGGGMGIHSKVFWIIFGKVPGCIARPGQCIRFGLRAVAALVCQRVFTLIFVYCCYII